MRDTFGYRPLTSAPLRAGEFLVVKPYGGRQRPALVIRAGTRVWGYAPDGTPSDEQVTQHVTLAFLSTRHAKYPSYALPPCAGTPRWLAAACAVFTFGTAYHDPYLSYLNAAPLGALALADARDWLSDRLNLIV